MPAQTSEPNRVQIPASLAFAAPLVEALNQSGLSITAIQSSVAAAYFQSTDRAVWIETGQGILEAIFFSSDAEAGQVRITENPDQTGAGRYLYTIQAPPPTLPHDLTIDSASKLYFMVAINMLLQTDSADLDQTLKKLFSPGF